MRSSKVRVALAVLALSLGTSICAQDKPNPAPKYIPPSCQGKPIIVVPRAVMLAQTPTEVKPNPPIARTDQVRLFNALARIIDETYVYSDFNGQN